MSHKEVERLGMRHLAGILTILMLVLGSATGAPLPPCNMIVNQLNPCVPFLTRNMATPSQMCCNGVRYLANYSSSKADRISICQCIEGSRSMFPLVDFSLISDLPASCRVPITLPKITPTFDCSTA